jgi:hypothetical protein
MSALPWVFGEDTAVTPDKFCSIEQQEELLKEAERLGLEIAARLEAQLAM